MAINKLNKNPKNTYQVNENHDLCIAAAIQIGCSVVNIGGKDLEAGVPHLTLGLLWQIIKVRAPLPKLYKLTKGPSSAEFDVQD